MRHVHRIGSACREAWPVRVVVPAPRVAVPDVRQHMYGRRVRPSVRDGDPEKDVLGRRLRPLDRDVEVARVLEDAGIDDLELGLEPAARRIAAQELLVRVRALRVLVEHSLVRTRWQRILEPVELLHVLAMVALGVREAEEPFLQDRVGTIPQCHRQAEHLLAVAEAADAVLSPPVCAAARMVVREVVPRGPICAVVLAHRAPLAVADVRTPSPPVGTPEAVILEARVLCGHLGLRAHATSMVSLVAGRSSAARPSISRSQSLHTFSAAATLHACIGQPPGVCGASPSCTSETDPSPASRR